MSTDVLTTLALKEWGAAVHALLDGRQTVLLRKGGIHEKAFEVPGEASSGRFVLFPTVAHSHTERVRPEHRDVLARGDADVDEVAGTLTVRAGVSLVDAVQVRRPDGLREIEDLHIWTHESIVTDRLDFRPKKELQVLVVRAVALPDAVTLERVEAYGGCKSWLDLPVAWTGDARQVHDNARLAQDVERVRRAVG